MFCRRAVLSAEMERKVNITIDARSELGAIGADLLRKINQAKQENNAPSSEKYMNLLLILLCVYTKKPQSIGKV